MPIHEAIFISAHQFFNLLAEPPHAFHTMNSILFFRHSSQSPCLAALLFNRLLADNLVMTITKDCAHSAKSVIVITLLQFVIIIT